VPSNRWINPPLAPEFAVTATNGTLFSGITELPSGLVAPLTVSVNGNVLGQFTAGQSVSFQAFPGGGVSEFVVSNPDNPLGVPLKLAFTTSTGSFTTAFVPEPHSLTITLALAALVRIRRRRPPLAA
jgi:hypothetical protein